MRTITRLIFTLSVMFAIIGLSTNNAYSYIDPGSGSIIVQLLIALFLGFLVSIKIYWQKLKTFMEGLFRKKTEQEEE